MQQLDDDEKKFYDTDARFPDATHAGQGAHLVGRRQPDAGMDRLSRSRCHPALLHGQAGGLAPDLEHRLRDHQSGGFFLPNSNSWYCDPEAYVTNIFTAVIYTVPKYGALATLRQPTYFSTVISHELFILLSP